ncbi:hypothetical protein N7499_006597 [Penicillium canescens]|nr:hypothetical protein N7522_008748 [Penicillium canescens]KAJ6081723.1 hypothetical protein N7499_006597 [Penicillium canescens]KAJ6176477.1 hypothetical protein N7485_003391 [Penicillium canescens]
METRMIEIEKNQLLDQYTISYWNSIGSAKQASFGKTTEALEFLPKLKRFTKEEFISVEALSPLYDCFDKEPPVKTPLTQVACTFKVDNLVNETSTFGDRVFAANHFVAMIDKYKK